MRILIILVLSLFLCGCQSKVIDSWDQYTLDNQKIWEAERIKQHREALNYLKFSENSSPLLQEGMDRTVLKLKQLEEKMINEEKRRKSDANENSWLVVLE